MNQTVPAATLTAAAQRDLGAHQATYEPGKGRRDTTRLDLFERGVVAELKGGGLFAVPWGALQVYEEIVSRSSVVSRSYTLVEYGRGKAYLGGWSQAAEFGPLIQEAVVDAWLPKLLDHIAQGKPYDFVTDERRPKNNLGLRAEGLNIKGSVWPWSRIRSIEFNAGMFYVKASGKLTPLAYNLCSIPNVHVLLKAARLLHARAS